MSAYAVDLICWRVLHDRAFREAMQRDVRSAIADADVSDAEREALIAGDVGRLYDLGAHAFLMRYLASYGIAGLTAERYSERIRAAASAGDLDHPGY